MKKKPIPKTKSPLKKTKVPELPLVFSFKYFDNSDNKMCPYNFQKNYTQSLMQRLNTLSSWTVQEFTARQDKNLRNHSHDWSKTTRPKGFAHLNEHLQNYKGWQFQISSNKHGRVHGFIIDNIFYVVWLDQDHQLYS